MISGKGEIILGVTSVCGSFFLPPTCERFYNHYQSLPCALCSLLFISDSCCGSVWTILVWEDVSSSTVSSQHQQDESMQVISSSWASTFSASSEKRSTKDWMSPAALPSYSTSSTASSTTRTAALYELVYMCRCVTRKEDEHEPLM